MYLLSRPKEYIHIDNGGGGVSYRPRAKERSLNGTQEEARESRRADSPVASSQCFLSAVWAGFGSCD